MRLPRVRFTIRRMMIAVAAVAVLTAVGIRFGPDTALIVGTFVFAELILAFLFGRAEGFSTGGTVVIAATGLFWAWQYAWWRNPAAVTFTMSIFCMATVPVWYLRPRGSVRLLITQMQWGMLTMIAALAVTVVLVVLSVSFIRWCRLVSGS
jgi:hypothetical protein